MSLGFAKNRKSYVCNGCHCGPCALTIPDDLAMALFCPDTGSGYDADWKEVDVEVAKVKVKRLVDDAELPRQMTGGSAGMDLCSHEECFISAGKRQLVGIGIAVSIQPGYEGQIRPRSGMATKGVTVLNSPGTIDSDYRGEVKVLLVNHDSMGFRIMKGDRIAQLVIAPVPYVDLEEVDELDSTVRGSGGFGSTGS